MGRYWDDFTVEDDELLHYGVKGMKWRKRKTKWSEKEKIGREKQNEGRMIMNHINDQISKINKSRRYELERKERAAKDRYRKLKPTIDSIIEARKRMKDLRKNNELQLERKEKAAKNQARMIERSKR